MRKILIFTLVTLLVSEISLPCYAQNNFIEFNVNLLSFNSNSIDKFEPKFILNDMVLNSFDINKIDLYSIQNFKISSVTQQDNFDWSPVITGVFSVIVGLLVIITLFNLFSNLGSLSSSGQSKDSLGWFLVFIGIPALIIIIILASQKQNNRIYN